MAVARKRAKWRETADDLVRETDASAARKRMLKSVLPKTQRVAAIVLASLLTSSINIPNRELLKKVAANEAERRQLSADVNKFLEGKNFPQVIAALNKSAKDPSAVRVLAGVDLLQRLRSERGLDSLGVSQVNCGELGVSKFTLSLHFPLTEDEQNVVESAVDQAAARRASAQLNSMISRRLAEKIPAVRKLVAKHLGEGGVFVVQGVEQMPYAPFSSSMTQVPGLSPSPRLAGVITVTLTASKRPLPSPDSLAAIRQAAERSYPRQPLRLQKQKTPPAQTAFAGKPFLARSRLQPRRH